MNLTFVLVGLHQNRVDFGALGAGAVTILSVVVDTEQSRLRLYSREEGRCRASRVGYLSIRVVRLITIGNDDNGECDQENYKKRLHYELSRTSPQMCYVLVNIKR